MENTHLPVDHLNAELRKLGRSLADCSDAAAAWQGDQFGINVTWPDGFKKFVAMGQEASGKAAAAHAAFHARPAAGLN